MKHDAWPGYPKTVQLADAPIWHQRQWEDQTLNRELAEDRGAELMETMMDWQAPLENTEAAA